MSRRARDLWIVVGAFATGVALYVGGVDVDANCQPVSVACNFALDGGYSERSMRASLCADAGVVLPLNIEAASSIVDGSCRFIEKQARQLAADAGVNEAESESGGCACWQRDAGACESKNPRTGRWGAALHRVEIQPGHWRGVGCVPKPCGELFGFPSTPSPCN